jgi:transcriptional regulator with XRE-family HTH domain
MESLRKLRKEAGFTQRSFGEAVYKRAKLSISPAYSQKVCSLWESAIISPPEEFQSIICEILKIDPSEISFAISQRSTKDFINFLVDSGLEKEDAKLLADNKALQDAVLKAMVKSTHRLCEEFRSFESKLDSVS